MSQSSTLTGASSFLVATCDTSDALSPSILDFFTLISSPEPDERLRFDPTWFSSLSEMGSRPLLSSPFLLCILAALTSFNSEIVTTYKTLIGASCTNALESGIPMNLLAADNADWVPSSMSKAVIISTSVSSRSTRVPFDLVKQLGAATLTRCFLLGIRCSVRMSPPLSYCEGSSLPISVDLKICFSTRFTGLDFIPLSFRSPKTFHLPLVTPPTWQ